MRTLTLDQCLALKTWWGGQDEHGSRCGNRIPLAQLQDTARKRKALRGLIGHGIVQVFTCPLVQGTKFPLQYRVRLIAPFYLRVAEDTIHSHEVKRIKKTRTEHEAFR